MWGGGGLFFVEYDANGNLIVDSDRKILQIQYNLLNLPSQIFFENGNVIVNIYASNGMKLETRYITQITQDLSPIEKTLENVSNIQAMSGKVYAGNIEYEYGNIRRQLALARVLNAEGYVTPLAGNSWGYFYYRQDYLGNNREVWQAPVFGIGAGEVVQITNYYPSGLPWAYNAGSGADLQPYKYNGKEFIEENGLDEYDSSARMYYPAIARTTTPDPHAENYYNISPYAWVANRFTMAIDPTGMDSIDRVQAAYNMVGTPYPNPYEGGALRTANTSEALKYMDCTEFVFRVMAADGITNGVQGTAGRDATQAFFFDDKKFIRIKPGEGTPQPGDVAGWEGSTPTNGHWGIVTEVGKDGTFKLTHARGTGKLSAENGSCQSPSVYNPGTFLGFFRPINETEGGKVAPVEGAKNAGGFYILPEITVSVPYSKRQSPPYTPSPVMPNPQEVTDELKSLIKPISE